MKTHNTESLKNRIRGWLPKEPITAYASKASKPRWRKPYWIAFTLVSVIVLSSIIFVGARTYMRFSNPQEDITASYYEKTLNSTIASVGDTVEVKVLVYWHGYVIPEFKREVKIVDPFSENNFKLIGGNNTYFEPSGYGGSYQLKYLLKVIGEQTTTMELPKPRLYLDNFDIPLMGTSTVLELQTFSETES